MKTTIGLFLLSALAFVAAVAAAQDANQAAKTPASSPPAQDSATVAPAPSSSPSASGAALFPMPPIPDEDRADAPMPASSVSPRQELIPIPAAADEDRAGTSMTPALASSGHELFPMPAVPDEDRADPPVPPSASSRAAELFPMPAIPEEDVPSAPEPLTEAELEMQALIQSAIGTNPALTAANVNVAMSSDGIELSGTVANVQAKLAASRLAKSYAAGKKVVDKITVSASPPETHPEPSPVKADSPGTAHQQHP